MHINGPPSGNTKGHSATDTDNADRSAANFGAGNLNQGTGRPGSSQA